MYPSRIANAFNITGCRKLEYCAGSRLRSMRTKHCVHCQKVFSYIALSLFIILIKLGSYFHHRQKKYFLILQQYLVTSDVNVSYFYLLRYLGKKHASEFNII